MSNKNPLKDTPLHQAVKKADIVKIQQLGNKKSINAKNASGMTPLHCAAQNNNPRVINALLALNARKNTRDYFGRTALDIALHGKKDDAIRALGSSVNHPEYGKPKINQKLVNQKLVKYLSVISEVENRNRTQFLTNHGHCNGWSFLYQYYIALHAEQQFVEIMQLIATWDGKRASLNKSLATIPNISNATKTTYKTLGDLLEFTINDLVWFQQSSEFKESANIEIKQKEREKQWNIIHDNNLSLSNICRFAGKGTAVSKNKLIELLEIAAKCPDTWIDLGYKKNAQAGWHAVSISITSDGKLRYFNCNNHFNIPTPCSARQVSAFLSKGSPDGIILRSFSINKFKIRKNKISSKHPSMSQIEKPNYPQVKEELNNLLCNGLQEVFASIPSSKKTAHNTAAYLTSSQQSQQSHQSVFSWIPLFIPAASLIFWASGLLELTLALMVKTGALLPLSANLLSIQFLCCVTAGAFITGAVFCLYKIALSLKDKLKYSPTTDIRVQPDYSRNVNDMSKTQTKNEPQMVRKFTPLKDLKQKATPLSQSYIRQPLNHSAKTCKIRQ